MSGGAGWARKFEIGDKVRIDTREAVGHCRTPWFLRGHTGTVVGLQGRHRDPERLAYHLSGLPELYVYKVRFNQAELWPGYQGAPGDRLEADIFENWLLPEPGTTGHA